MVGFLPTGKPESLQGALCSTVTELLLPSMRAEYFQASAPDGVVLTFRQRRVAVPKQLPSRLRLHSSQMPIGRNQHIISSISNLKGRGETTERLPHSS